MVEILLFFIGASLLLYVIFGGADYGAGILELFPLPKHLKKRQTEIVNEAMGPVWEANHIWLILINVILFIGFPSVFTTIMISLHIPMVALLVGIVSRGCAFTFRHYDAIYEEKSQAVYTAIFGLSSLWTSLWLGVIVASLSTEKIDINTLDFFQAYINPWLGFYNLFLGLFVVCIFCFLASIYLIGETEDEELKNIFVKRSNKLNLIVVSVGVLVFIVSYLEGGKLLQQFFTNPYSSIPLLGAWSCSIVLRILTEKRSVNWARVVAATQVSLILIGWLTIYAPNALLTVAGPMSFYNAAAPEASLRQLVIALLVGSCFIFPGLFCLFRVFKMSRN
jgi:cytochrome bd ubiquinol oxidase subunit II